MTQKGGNIRIRGPICRSPPGPHPGWPMNLILAPGMLTCPRPCVSPAQPCASALVSRFTCHGYGTRRSLDNGGPGGYPVQSRKHELPWISSSLQAASRPGLLHESWQVVTWERRLSKGPLLEGKRGGGAT